MNEEDAQVFPSIINAGIFDAGIAFHGAEVTKKRKGSVFEIEIPIGQGGVSYINNRAYPIRSDCIICAKPGQTRYTALPFKCYYLHMLPGSSRFSDYIMNTPDVFHILQKAEYVRLFTAIIAAHCSPCDGGELLIQSRIFELFYRIHMDTKRFGIGSVAANTANSGLIIKALHYLDNHYGSKSTLKDVAKYVNLSPVYFHKVFTCATGQTPYRYLLEKRLEAAKNLLFFSDLSLSEIAFECGFSSQSYFNYVFKKQVGVSPNQYKKNVYDKYPL